MLWARSVMDVWIGEDGEPPQIKTLTTYFLALYFIMATQVCDWFFLYQRPSVLLRRLKRTPLRTTLGVLNGQLEESNSCLFPRHRISLWTGGPLQCFPMRTLATDPRATPLDRRWASSFPKWDF